MSSVVWLIVNKIVTTLALSELDENNKVSIFPNPSNGIFNIESHQQILEIFIFDKLGRRILVIQNPGFKTQINFLIINQNYFLLRFFLTIKQLDENL